jgi:hypothetical protein
MAVILGVTAIGAWLIGTDKVSYVVTHGVSMNPVYYQDDLVILVKQGSYEVGQIAAYHGVREEVLHRITGGNATRGFVFKGDNNQSIDIPTPTGDELIGRAVLHVPKGGIWLKPVLSPTGLGMIGFLIVGGGAATARNRREIPRGRRKKKVKAMARQGGPWATAVSLAKVVARLPPLLRIVAGAAAALALFSVVLGVLGWMKPVTERRVASSGPVQKLTYSYSAHVPRSPAYDTTTVTSPDPIFRKLTDRVAVRMRYEGSPGTFAANATLSDNSGWHTVLALFPAKKFEGNILDATADLDLKALEARERAAAATIGVPPTPLTITIKAQVTGAGPDFAAPLTLSVVPFQMTLEGGEASLVVTNAEAGDAATLVVRTIGIAGHPLMTAARARGLAVLLLFAAAVGAAAIFLATRRATPLRTRAQIEGRYPNLLVPVEAMPTAPGTPVIGVDNFPALVKLAERYGQMILTWRNPDTDDFVVRDEGITYRYQIALDETPTLHNVERINRPPIGSHRRKASSPMS